MSELRFTELQTELLFETYLLERSASTKPLEEIVEKLLQAIERDEIKLDDYNKRRLCEEYEGCINSTNSVTSCDFFISRLWGCWKGKPLKTRKVKVIVKKIGQDILHIHAYPLYDDLPDLLNIYLRVNEVEDMYSPNFKKAVIEWVKKRLHEEYGSYYYSVDDLKQLVQRLWQKLQSKLR